MSYLGLLLFFSFFLYNKKKKRMSLEHYITTLRPFFDMTKSRMAVGVCNETCYFFECISCHTTHSDMTFDEFIFGPEIGLHEWFCYDCTLEFYKLYPSCPKRRVLFWEAVDYLSKPINRFVSKQKKSSLWVYIGATRFR